MKVDEETPGSTYTGVVKDDDTLICADQMGSGPANKSHALVTNVYGEVGAQCH
jgi:hypothetical protein